MPTATKAKEATSHHIHPGSGSDYCTYVFNTRRSGGDGDWAWTITTPFTPDGHRGGGTLYACPVGRTCFQRHVIGETIEFPCEYALRDRPNIEAMVTGLTCKAHAVENIFRRRTPPVRFIVRCSGTCDPVAVNKLLEWTREKKLKLPPKEKFELVK